MSCRQGDKQQTSYTPLLLPIEGTDGRTDERLYTWPLHKPCWHVTSSILLVHEAALMFSNISLWMQWMRVADYRWSADSGRLSCFCRCACCADCKQVFVVVTVFVVKQWQLRCLRLHFACCGSFSGHHSLRRHGSLLWCWLNVETVTNNKCTFSFNACKRQWTLHNLQEKNLRTAK